MVISIARLRQALIVCTAMHGGSLRQKGRKIYIMLDGKSVRLLYRARTAAVTVTVTPINTRSKAVGPCSVAVCPAMLSSCLRDLYESGERQVRLAEKGGSLLLTTPTRCLIVPKLLSDKTPKQSAHIIPFERKNP